MLPGPLVPKLMPPGLALAAAIRSPSVLCGELTGTTRMLAPVAVSDTGTKSFSMLYGTLLMIGFTDAGPRLPITKV
jgi:hypothetical protein